MSCRILCREHSFKINSIEYKKTMYTCSMRSIGASKGVERNHLHNLRGARYLAGQSGRLFIRRDLIRDVVCQAKDTKRDKKPLIEQFRPPSKARIT